MKSLGAIALGLGFALLAVPGTSSSGSGLASKENLDLPYDALGSSENEAEAPEIVLLYGGAYAANSVVFCIDESKSMRKNNRWAIQKREITTAIMGLTSSAEFGMVFYGVGAHAFRGAMLSATQANKAAAIAFLESIQLSLGTCLGQGAVKSLEMIRRSPRRHRAVIVAGDGRPTRCPFVPGQGGASTAEITTILQKISVANPGRQIPVHTIYVGSSSDPRAVQFMRNLALAHRGTFRSAHR